LVASPTPVIYTPTNVKIYDADKAPTQPTTEISVVQVDLYNQYGIKRQKAEVNEMLKAQACSVGGNALILIDNSDTKHCYAEVVQIDPKVASTSNNAAPSTSTSATTPISATK